MFFRRRPDFAVAATVVLVALDGLMSFGVGSELLSSPGAAGLHALYSPSKLPSWGSVVQSPGGLVRYLYLGQKIEPAQPSFPEATDLKSLRSGNGYDPLAPRAYLETLGMRQDGSVEQPGRLLRHPGWMLDLLRVSTLIIPTSDRPRNVSTIFTLLSVNGHLARYRYVLRLPDAFLVSRPLAATHAAAVAAIRGGQGFEPRREALLEGCGECTPASRGGVAGTVRNERRWDGAITLETESDRPAALVVSEAWFPGWEASVDGRPKQVMRADGFVLGVLVPPGRHRIRLRYVAPGVDAGASLSVASLIALAAVAIAINIKRRRASAQ
jgi:membrane protein YfhO